MMMPAVALLVGGYARRLYPATKTTPKAMLPVAGKPFISHQLALLKEKGMLDVVLCSGYLSKQIEDFVGSGKQFGLSVKYSVDGDKLLGTGGAIKKALPFLGDIFFVVYGDSYVPIDFWPIHDYFMSSDKKGLMTVFKNSGKFDVSNVVFENGTIRAYDKKEKTPDMEYIDFGLGMLRRAAFDSFAGRDAFDLAELYQYLIAEKQMLGYEAKDRFFEIGSVNGLEETAQYLSGLSKEKQGSYP